MAANIRHSSKTSEHYTRAPEVELARLVLGGIDLDPASCKEANKVVKAAAFFDERRDGLSVSWHGRVFVNPPGGQLVVPKRTPKDDTAAARLRGHANHFCTRSQAVAWWRKLVEEYEERRVTAAVFLGFSLEVAQASQQGLERYPFRLLPLDCTFCVPRTRLRFTGNSPSHANLVVYLGPERELFRRVFGSIGKVVG